MMLQAPGSPSDLPSVGFIVAAILSSLPVLGLFVWGAVKVLGPIGQALAHRIGGHAGGTEDLRGELAEVHRRLDEVQSQLAETHERLDFAERLLARGERGERLPEGR
jgi:hypothetical protein